MKFRRREMVRGLSDSELSSEEERSVATAPTIAFGKKRAIQSARRRMSWIASNLSPSISVANISAVPKQKVFRSSSVPMNLGAPVKGVPKIRPSDIVLGKLLGSGKYGQIQEIRKAKLSSSLDSDNDERPSASKTSLLGRQPLASLISDLTSKNELQSLYVVKTIRAGLDTRDEIDQAASDLTNELHFLSSLDHQNIVTLRGVAGEGQFLHLIIDRLSETLSERIDRWKKMEQRPHNNRALPLIRDKKICVPGSSFEDRVNLACRLSEALTYMHAQQIMHRDLKPSNIGFDIHGDVKIFDFGMAKELLPSHKVSPTSDLYRLSGQTGSMRYMAPEVYQGLPYNMTADVYSLSLIVWEVLALKKVFAGFNCAMYVDSVVERDFRPDLVDSWSEPVKGALSSSWSRNIPERPTSSCLAGVLQKEYRALHLFRSKQ